MIMAVVVDMRLPAESFNGGVPFDLPSDAEIEFDQTVPRGREGAVPFIWVTTADFEGFERAMRDHPRVADVELLDETDGGRLYHLDWTPPVDLCGAIAWTDADIVEGSADGESAQLRLRFPDNESVTRFGELCDERGVSMTPVRIARRTEGREGVELTDQQRESLLAALRFGYFDVPRRATLVDIADELGVSDQAVSERIRRGVSRLVEANVGSPE